MEPSDASPTFVVNRRPFWLLTLVHILISALAIAFGLGDGEVAQDDAAVVTGVVFGGLGLVAALLLLAIPAKRMTLSPDGLRIGGRSIPYDRLRLTPIETRDLGEVDALAFDIQVLDPSGRLVESIPINDRRWREFERLHAALLEAIRERGARGLSEQLPR